MAELRINNKEEAVAPSLADGSNYLVCWIFIADEDGDLTIKEVWNWKEESWTTTDIVIIPKWVWAVALPWLQENMK